LLRNIISENKNYRVNSSICIIWSSTNYIIKSRHERNGGPPEAWRGRYFWLHNLDFYQLQNKTRA
jgi:hypothetical protein